MSNYARKYAKGVENSVKHIFSNFLNDQSVSEVYNSQTHKDDSKRQTVWIEIDGSFEGEIVILFPEETLKNLTKHFSPKVRVNALKAAMRDVSGELANQITGTLANQLQYIDHKVRLAPPEFDEDPIQVKAFYDNISISFATSYGGFDIELYYKDGLYT
ncbi:MAG: chemotaxis protein CheX [Spirochaetes bacterium]|nr:chemotaxis protein CheX [Spirochaetota bacterium]